MKIISEDLKQEFYSTIHHTLYQELMDHIDYGTRTDLDIKLYDPLMDNLIIQFNNMLDEKLEEDLEVYKKYTIFNKLKNK